MMELTPGQVLGDRFVLVRRVAEGRTAEVWLGEDRRHERRVALKLFDARLLDSPAAEARLRAEIEAGRSLPPGLVVPVRALHRLDGLAVLEMDYLPGGDLGQYRGRSFPAFATALDQVAQALAAAHERGLVHRDLKCANVLLDAEGRARLADFGLSSPAGAVAGGGSPYNMSPQQIRGEPATPEDDLYAFGAMLYELLSGHPPYYPDITPERVIHEPVPPLVPRLAAPERLRQLALRLLAKSPAERPASAEAVRRELAAALDEPVDEAARVPHVASRAADEPPPAAAPRPRRPPRWAGATAAVVLLLGLAVLVFLWLPGYVAQRSATAGREAASAALAEAERMRRAGEDQATRAAARDQAEAARTAFGEALAAIEGHAAAVWATAGLAAVRERGAEAGKLFDLGRYEDARSAWEGAAAAVGEIDGQRPTALAAALEEGRQALARGQAAAAAAAFERALKIGPGNAAAEAGLARAGTLDEVLAAVDAAAREEQAGRYTPALEGYRKALSIDAEAPGAREGIERITRRQSNEAFSAVMSRGMEALAAGRTDAARTAFEQAGAMRPGSTEVEDALARLERESRAARLRALRQRAEEAERGERWKEAQAAWSEALGIEPTLAPALAGLERVGPRVGLDDRFDALFDEPERLWQATGRAAAASLLAAAADAPPPTAVLQQRAERLAAMLRAAETPVPVQLESDGVTEVVIYRIGRMGSFRTRQVELMPGRYAVVGTRPGYRDVREDVVIRPGTAPEPVVVRCEEPI